MLLLALHAVMGSPDASYREHAKVQCLTHQQVQNIEHAHLRSC